MGGLTRPDACHQRLGIGLPGKLDELGSEVFLKGPSGQGGAGSEFVAGFVGDIPDCNGHTHSIIMLLMLLLCNVATIRATLPAARPAQQQAGLSQRVVKSLALASGTGQGTRSPRPHRAARSAIVQGWSHWWKASRSCPTSMACCPCSTPCSRSQTSRPPT